ncbi:HEPN domain-containing protein [Trinickia fusca]|uniref:HEPN domain-containing protein n=1 Tax=Trinickia fusca TaxID=2419777 RepID=A0A494XA29_9BURK|nr:HEPN domain-containing protein [Trinickia fusca]RKP47637.1 HEPN domain-containing protein [Trinickia fusca]
MPKHDRALAAAYLLLDSGDVEGACNRAYYAMFYAAYVALLAAGVSFSAESSLRKHSGLIAAFGLQLVKTNLVAPEFGSAINKVERLRRLADYTGETIADEDARWAVEQADAFVAMIRSTFMHP